MWTRRLLSTRWAVQPWSFEPLSLFGPAGPARCHLAMTELSRMMLMTSIRWKPLTASPSFSALAIDETRAHRRSPSLRTVRLGHRTDGPFGPPNRSFHRPERLERSTSSNRCLTSSNKKLLETSATLVVTGALLVVTRSY